MREGSIRHDRAVCLDADQTPAKLERSQRVFDRRETFAEEYVAVHSGAERKQISVQGSIP
jgi:hypothetical protein